MGVAQTRYVFHLGRRYTIDELAMPALTTFRGQNRYIPKNAVCLEFLRKYCPHGKPTMT